jgi:peroxiredoxin
MDQKGADMTAVSSLSPPLAERFAALEKAREASWPRAQLAANLHQRQLLIDAYDSAAHPQPGAPIPPFTLIGADHRPVTSDSLLAHGPAVLVFFRFGACPACNIALPYYEETLCPRLRAAGVPLVAVSAQTPVDTGIVVEHGLTFPVTADPDYTLGRHLGITFFPENQPPVAPGAAWIGATLGTNSYEMTQPAVVILNADGTLRHLIVSPDWLDRPEAEDILAYLPEA